MGTQCGYSPLHTIQGLNVSYLQANVHFTQGKKLSGDLAWMQQAIGAISLCAGML